MPVTDDPGLTPSEETVMRYYTDGLTREEIAAAMVVSHHTVHAHLRNAKQKLDARNMAQAGARFARLETARAAEPGRDRG
ncbi:MAG: hypothetical protein NVS3B7_04150 [Candidatus Elarobacter sp.]